MLDFEVVKHRLIVILCRKAGVEKVSSDIVPLSQTAIVEHFELLGNDKRHIAICQALLEYHKTANTTIAILEWVYRLKALMQVYNILKRLSLFAVVLF